MIRRLLFCALLLLPGLGVLAGPVIGARAQGQLDEGLSRLANEREFWRALLGNLVRGSRRIADGMLTDEDDYVMSELVSKAVFLCGRELGLKKITEGDVLKDPLLVDSRRSLELIGRKHPKSRLAGCVGLWRPDSVGGVLAGVRSVRVPDLQEWRKHLDEEMRHWSNYYASAPRVKYVDRVFMPLTPDGYLSLPYAVLNHLASGDAPLLSASETKRRLQLYLDWQNQSRFLPEFELLFQCMRKASGSLKTADDYDRYVSLSLQLLWLSRTFPVFFSGADEYSRTVAEPVKDSNLAFLFALARCQVGPATAGDLRIRLYDYLLKGDVGRFRGTAMANLVGPYLQAMFPLKYGHLASAAELRDLEERYLKKLRAGPVKR